LGELNLRLTAAPGVLDPRLITGKSQGREYITLADEVELLENTEYKATLSYDMSMKEVSIRLLNLKNTKMVYDGSFPIAGRCLKVYPTVGCRALKSSEGEKPKWRYFADRTQYANINVRASLPGVLRDEYIGGITLPDSASDNGYDENGTLPELFSGDKITLQVASIHITLPGKVTLQLNNGAKLYQGTAGKKPIEKAVSLPVLKPGNYKAVLAYNQPGIKVALAEKSFKIISGRIFAEVQVPEDRPWVTGGKMSGTIKIRGDRELGKVRLELQARSRGNANWNKVGQGEVDGLGKEASSINFEYESHLASFQELL
jgi:hypothetical protein